MLAYYFEKSLILILVTYVKGRAQDQIQAKKTIFAANFKNSPDGLLPSLD